MGWNEKEFNALMQNRNNKCSKQENWDKDKYNEYATKSKKTTGPEKKCSAAGRKRTRTKARRLRG